MWETAWLRHTGKGRMPVIELLAPAGNMSKMRAAFDYGADAVYIGGGAFGLRANAGNFTDAEIEEAVRYANSMNKKIYVTANIIARNEDLKEIGQYAKRLSEAGVHGIIVSDPGVFLTVRDAAPDIPVHVSTQANNLNYRTCEFWHNMGAARVNLARELTIAEIADINAYLKRCGCGMETEAFVHGAMCMSYSGRCMLSDYFTGRSSNRGDCAQPCRWNYGINVRGSEINASLTEENRPGELFDVTENERGTFIFNSKDLCMIDHLKELKDAGVTAFKIEGRMKSEFYVAVTVRAYRMAIDALENGNPVLPGTQKAADLMYELSSVSHRDYSTGFYMGEKGSQIYGTSSYTRGSDFIGTADGCVKCADNDPNGEACVYRMTMTQRGTFEKGDTLEFVPPEGDIRRHTVSLMYDSSGDIIERAPHAMMKVVMDIPFYVPSGCIIRRRKK